MAPAVPQRERTLMGIGASEGEQPASREVERPAAAAQALQAPAREPSSISGRPEHVPSGKPSPAPAGRLHEARGGARGRWVIIVLFLVIAGIAAYVLLDGFLRPPGR
jgi:hypothetical protein